jgi:hypothetical protein
VTDPINRCCVKNESRQEQQKFVETILEVPIIEPEPEACEDCRDCRQDIVDDDEPLAIRQLQYRIHELATGAPLPESLTK